MRTERARDSHRCQAGTHSTPARYFADDDIWQSTLVRNRKLSSVSRVVNAYVPSFGTAGLAALYILRNKISCASILLYDR
jgi:hypothetical protein